MVSWLWTIIGIMALLMIALLVKIYILQKAAKEISDAFADRLITDTNTLIDISSNDRYMRKLAYTINVELRKLRVQQHRFQQGDAELKNAVTNISHDLRTPLTAICGYLELLEQEEKSDKAEQYIDIIRNRSQTLISLTEELFRYSVMQSEGNDMVKERVVINNILEESIAVFYTDLCRHNIAPVIEIPDEKVIRTLNRSALSRIFSNLLSNAIKYSDGDLHIILYDTGEIIFSNTASTLNEIQVGKLFDRFFTVEAARKSTGLGLSIAKNLTEQMNGTIAAKYDNDMLSISITFPENSII